MSATLDVLLLVVGCAHVYFAPHAKVEESFNLHATHDILMYGIGKDSLEKFDHFVFPGAVPRTFIGSIVLAWLTRLAMPMARAVGFLHDKFDLQLFVRYVLVAYNVLGFALLRRAVFNRYGRPVGLWFSLLTVTQFHVPFWMSRTLPNMLALLPVNLALLCLHDRAPNALRPTKHRVHLAIALLTFTTVVFRAELLMFLGPVVLQCLFSKYTTFGNVISIGLVAGLASVALTVSVDSYFWQQNLLWPEAYGIYFNVIQGKSSDWGVSPWYEYIVQLGKLLLSSSVLSIVGAIVDHRIRSLLWPAVLFVVLMSGLAHKEWRFIVYVVPVFNIAAARGAWWLASRRKSTVAGRIALAGACGLLVVNAFAAGGMFALSKDNYPGGVALSRFNDMYASQQDVHVHISNLPAQTGATLFLQTHAPPYLPGLEPVGASNWVYDKTEHLEPWQITSSRNITHIIAEIPPNGVQNTFDATGFSARHWRLTSVVTAYAGAKLTGFRYVKGIFRPPWDARVILEKVFKLPWNILEITKTEQLAILERK